MRKITLWLFIVVCASCSAEVPPGLEAQLDPIAERYVRLALALGEHDEDYVDAYFGPDEWREQAKEGPLDLNAIIVAADQLVAELQALDPAGAEKHVALRHNFLLSHTSSMAAVSRMRSGETLRFDEESKALYGFVAPSFPREHYESAMQKLNALLPGEGSSTSATRYFDSSSEFPRTK